MEENLKVKVEIEAASEFNDTISSYLDEAAQIIETQNNMASMIQQPSKNSLHSRHKNKMMDEWKTLDDMKNSLFSKILKSGADPIVNVYDDTIKRTREMKLSELCEMMGANVKPLDINEDTKKIERIAIKGSKIKKVVKNGKVFHLIKGEGNKTTH